jgi:hypothetical protein
MPVDPRHRANRIAQLVETGLPYPGDHPHEAALWQLLSDKTPDTDIVVEATGWANNPEIQHVIDAAMLGRAGDERIVKSLSCSLSALQAYRHLYFDIDVFPHTIAYRWYVNSLDCNDVHRNYYVVAINQSPAVLLREFEIGERTPIEPAKGREIIAESMFRRFMLNRDADITTDTAKAALEWGNCALKAFNDIDKTKQITGDDIGNIRVILERHRASVALSEEDLTPDNISG